MRDFLYRIYGLFFNERFDVIFLVMGCCYVYGFYREIDLNMINENFKYFMDILVVAIWDGIGDGNWI
jgi:hypothetical protein